ncbi:DUF5333 domain-containing protein [Acidimangrovimonas sediminis]|uniref:DUF5333 domain-containing protein n=1 Tax=Acidimangrovimonas sediminis TaxID=2056283 RepID=UPI0011AF5917|nr:DUF5333 domain-containing protein [Acidimangrovimonas sediminis]
MTIAKPLHPARRAALAVPVLAALLSAGLFAGQQAVAQTAPTVPLTKNAHVMESLTQARIADVIRHQCPSISGRTITAFFKAEQLKSYALQQGYSGDQIKAFLKDPAAKAEIHARADKALAAKGVTPGDAQSYCKVGKAEIASGTLAGSLLSD